MKQIFIFLLLSLLLKPIACEEPGGKISAATTNSGNSSYELKREWIGYAENEGEVLSAESILEEDPSEISEDIVQEDPGYDEVDDAELDDQEGDMLEDNLEETDSDEASDTNKEGIVDEFENLKNRGSLVVESEEPTENRENSVADIEKFVDPLKRSLIELPIDREEEIDDPELIDNEEDLDDVDEEYQLIERPGDYDLEEENAPSQDLDENFMDQNENDRRNYIADSDAEITGVDEDDLVEEDADQRAEVDPALPLESERGDYPLGEHSRELNADNILAEFDDEKDYLVPIEHQNYARDTIPDKKSLIEDSSALDGADDNLDEAVVENTSDIEGSSDEPETDQVEAALENDGDEMEASNDDDHVCEDTGNGRDLIEYEKYDYNTEDSGNVEYDSDETPENPEINFDCADCVSVDFADDNAQNKDEVSSTLSCPVNEQKKSNVVEIFAKNIIMSTDQSNSSKRSEISQFFQDEDYLCNEQCRLVKRAQIEDKLLRKLSVTRLWRKLNSDIKYHRIPRTSLGILLDGNVQKNNRFVLNMALNLALMFSKDSAITFGVFRECLKLVDMPAQIMMNPVSNYYKYFLSAKDLMKDPQLGKREQRNAHYAITDITKTINEKADLVDTKLKIIVFITNGPLTHTGKKDANLKVIKKQNRKNNILLYIVHLGSNYKLCQLKYLTRVRRIFIAHHLNQLIYGGQTLVKTDTALGGKPVLVTVGGVMNMLNKKFLLAAKAFEPTNGKITYFKGGFVGWSNDKQTSARKLLSPRNAIFPDSDDSSNPNLIERRQRITRPRRRGRRRLPRFSNILRRLRNNWYWSRYFPSLKKGVVNPANVIIVTDTMNGVLMPVMQKLTHYIATAFHYTTAKTTLFGINTLKTTEFCKKQTFARAEDVQRLVTTIPSSSGKTLTLAQHLLKMISPTSKLLSFKDKNVIIFIINHRAVDFASYNYVSNAINSANVMVYIIGIGLNDLNPFFSRLTTPNRVFTSLTPGGFFTETNFRRLLMQLKTDFKAADPLLNLDTLMLSEKPKARAKNPSARKLTVRRPRRVRRVRRLRTRKPKSASSRSLSLVERLQQRTRKRLGRTRTRTRRIRPRSFIYMTDDFDIERNPRASVMRRPIARRLLRRRRRRRRPVRRRTVRRRATRAKTPPKVTQIRRPSLLQSLDGVVGPANVFLVVDATFGSRMRIIRTFLKELLGVFQREGTAVTLASYASRYTLHTHVSQFRTTGHISMAVDKIKGLRSKIRNTGQALMETRRKLNSADPDYPPIIILLLNGASSDDYKVPSIILREDGIKVIVLVNGRSVPDREVLKIQSSSQLAFRTNFVRKRNIVSTLTPLLKSICGHRRNPLSTSGKIYMSQRTAAKQWDWKTFRSGIMHRRVAETRISTLLDTTSISEDMVKLLYNVIKSFSLNSKHSIRTVGLTDTSAYKLIRFKRYQDLTSTQLVLLNLLGNNLRRKSQTTRNATKRIRRVSRIRRRPAIRRRSKRDIIDDLLRDESDGDKRQRLRNPLSNVGQRGREGGYNPTTKHAQTGRQTGTRYTGTRPYKHNTRYSSYLNQQPSYDSSRSVERYPAYETSSVHTKPTSTFQTKSQRVGTRLTKNIGGRKVYNRPGTSNVKSTKKLSSNTNLYKPTRTNYDYLGKMVGFSDMGQLTSDQSSRSESTGESIGSTIGGIETPAIGTLFSENAEADTGAESSLDTVLQESGMGGKVASKGGRWGKAAQNVRLRGASKYWRSRGRGSRGRGGRLTYGSRWRRKHWRNRLSYYRRTWGNLARKLRRIGQTMRRSSLYGSYGPNQNNLVLLLLSNWPYHPKSIKGAQPLDDAGFSWAVGNITSLGIRFITLVMQQRKTSNKFAEQVLRSASTYFQHFSTSQAQSNLGRFQRQCVKYFGDKGTASYSLKYVGFKRNKESGFSVVPTFAPILPVPYETYLTTNYLTNIQHLRRTANWRKIVPGLRPNYITGNLNLIIAVDGSKNLYSRTIRRAVLNILRLFNKRYIRCSLVVVGRTSKIVLRNYYINSFQRMRYFVGKIRFSRFGRSEASYGYALNFISNRVIPRLRTTRRNVLIFVAQGKSRDDVAYAASSVKRKGTLVSVLGIGNKVNKPELQKISSSGQLLTVGEVSMLPLFIYRLQFAYSLTINGPKTLSQDISLKDSTNIRPLPTVFRAKNNDSPTKKTSVSTKNIFTSKRDFILDNSTTPISLENATRWNSEFINTSTTMSPSHPEPTTTPYNGTTSINTGATKKTVISYI